MPNVARELHEIYLAKGVHATTAIEGNTLNEEEVLKIVQGPSVGARPSDYLEQEVKNIIRAANEILDLISSDGARPLTIDDIKRYNKLVLKGLSLDDHVVAGEISKVQVGVHGYRGAPIELCNDLLKKLVNWLNSPPFNSHGPDEAIVYGLIKAIVAHVYLVWIHPFGDGNGRTARLLEVRFLLESGVPSAACHLLSTHYNQTRTEYYKNLAMASKNGGNLIPFIQYAVSGFVEQIRDQIKADMKQQWDISWINYVHEKFSNMSGTSVKRQRLLVLSLSEKDKPVPKKGLRRLSPKLAEYYVGLTEKTITRDVNALESIGMIKRVSSGYIANKDIMIQFIPRTSNKTSSGLMEGNSPAPTEKQLEFQID